MEEEVVEALRHVSSELVVLLDEASAPAAGASRDDLDHLLRLDRLATTLVDALRAESAAVRHRLDPR